MSVISVHDNGYGLQLLPMPNGMLALQIAISDVENILEFVRNHFQVQWQTSVHALRWIFPEYLFLSTSSARPYLLVYVDDRGNIPLGHTQDISYCGAVPHADGDVGRALISEALRPCPSQPWSAPDWLQRIRNWLEAALPGQVHAISQVRVSDGGAVLKIDGTRNTYYLKCVPSFLSAEVALLRVLHSKLPGFVPYTLPNGPDANTHITLAIDGTPLLRSNCADTWARSLRAIAEFQLASTQYLDEIRSTGIFHLSLSDLVTTMADSLADVIDMQRGFKNELSRDELRQIPNLIERATWDCDTLLSCGLPDTLINTDLNEGGIFTTSAGTTELIDWTFSKISHPFLTLQGTLFVPRTQSHRMSSAYEVLKAAYLSVWRKYCLEARLESALESACRLLSLTTALDLARYMPALMEDEPGHVLSLPCQLRNALSVFGLSVHRA